MFNRHRSIKFALLLPLTASSSGCGLRSSEPAQSPPPAPAARSTQLTVEPAIISLGTLRQGQNGRVVGILRNFGDAKISIGSIHSDCPCVHVAIAPREIAPAGSAELIVEYDATESPEFLGQLDVPVTAAAPNGMEVLQTRIHVDIISGESSRGGMTRATTEGTP